MRRVYFTIFSAFLIFIITSITLKQESPTRLFEKIIEFEIDFKEDSTLFTPYSSAWMGIWSRADHDLRAEGVELMNVAKYKSAFNNHKENLYTVLHPTIINGDVKVYSPYDPETFGLGSWDGADLRYPILGLEESTFLTDEVLRSQLIYYLGRLGPQSDLPLVTELGEDSTIVYPDGTIYYVYPPRDMIWFSDSDITKYRVRVKVLMNKKGKEKRRIIQSLAPVTNMINEMGELEGEMTMFWLDYAEISPILEEAYFFNDKGKPVTYLKYFQEKLADASI